jgi:hypothetical protein
LRSECQVHHVILSCQSISALLPKVRSWPNPAIKAGTACCQKPKGSYTVGYSCLPSFARPHYAAKLFF